MRSERLSASTWSWVTNSTVMLEPPLQQLHLDPHLLAQLGVQVAERLVEQEEVRLVHQARGRAPGAAAGRRSAGCRAALPGPPGRPARARGRPASRIAGRGMPRSSQGIGDVLEHGHVRPDRVATGTPCRGCACSGGTKSRRAAEATTRRAGDLAPSGCSRPATMRSVVVLPQPLGPSRVNTSPRRMVRSTLSTTGLAVNCLLSARSCRTGSATGSGSGGPTATADRPTSASCSNAFASPLSARVSE